MEKSHVKRKIPVLMYHSVGMENTGWLWSHISMPVSRFEHQLRTLKRHGYETINLDSYYEFKKGGDTKPAKKVVLTFDDGYLDNWVYVYSLLKKYGFRGTIFVNPEFVDPRDIKRPNMADVGAGKCAGSELSVPGFLTWPEIRAMQESGVMDIQSHTMSHTWHFCGERIVDFHHPGDEYPWLAWNEKPEKKYAYLVENQERLVPYGAPVYEHGRALGVRRYFEDMSLSDYLVSYVNVNGGNSFFEKNNWKEELFRIYGEYSEKHEISGRYETDDEYRLRAMWELGESKKILEDKLGKDVEFLCWPGGALTGTTINLAKELGYKAVTIPSKYRNSLDADSPFWVERTGTRRYVSFKSGKSEITNGRYFIWNLKLFEGKKIYRQKIRLYFHCLRLLMVFKHFLRKKRHEDLRKTFTFV